MNASQLQEIFSSNLKKARNRKNLSQMKLAENANLSVGYICDLESGRRWGTPETFAKLSEALNINPFELLLPKSEDSLSAEKINENHALFSKIEEALENNLHSAMKCAISETFLGLSEKQEK